MPDELRRAWEFLDRADMAGGRTVPSRVGTAVYDDEVPLRLDSNFLRVELRAEAEEVLAEAERLDRRMIVFRSTDEGERLAPFFAERGWLVRRHLLSSLGEDPVRVRGVPDVDCDTAAEPVDVREQERVVGALTGGRQQLRRPGGLS